VAADPASPQNPRMPTVLVVVDTVGPTVTVGGAVPVGVVLGVAVGLAVGVLVGVAVGVLVGVGGMAVAVGVLVATGTASTSNQLVVHRMLVPT
jgi:hypothetical protein